MTRESFERHDNADPFKEPHHQLPDELRVDESGLHDRNALRELLMGPEKREVVNREVVGSQKSESPFGKKGLARPKVRELFKKSSHHGDPLKAERIHEEGLMEREKFGEYISDKDMEKHLKGLKKAEYHAPSAEKGDIKKRRRWLGWLFGGKV